MSVKKQKKVIKSKLPLKTKREIKELLKFAEEFSCKFDKLSSGTFTSDEMNISIDYYNKIFQDRIKIKLPLIARVNNETGVMEISKSKLLEHKATPDYVFYMIVNLYSTYKTNLKRKKK